MYTVGPILGRKARATRVGPHGARTGGATGSGWIFVDARNLSVPYTDDRAWAGAAARGVGADVDKPIGQRGASPMYTLPS